MAVSPRTSAAEAPRGGSDSDARDRRWLIAWLHLGVLWTFAVAQPLFARFVDSPEFLVARGNAWPDILLVSLGLVVLPPTAMVAAELAVSRREKLCRLLHLGFVALLVAVLAIQVLKDLLGSLENLLPPLALAVGVALAIAYGRGRLVPTTLTVLSSAPPSCWSGFSRSPRSRHSRFRPGPTRARAQCPIRCPSCWWSSTSSRSLRCYAMATSTESDIPPSAPSPTRRPGTRTQPPWRTTQCGRYRPSSPDGSRTGDALPIDSEHPESIFHRLAGQYEFHVYEPVTHLCPPDLCPDTREGWLWRAQALLRSMASIPKHRVDPGNPGDFIGLPSETLENRPEEMRQYISELRPGRTLNVLHVELPHSPYQYGPNGRQYTEAVTLRV